MINRLNINISLDRLLWSSSVLLFIAGIVLPMFTFHKFYIFDDTYSLLSSTLYLVTQEEFFLFIVIFCFSIVVPLYKYYLLHLLISASLVDDKTTKLIQKLAFIGKWSMADVFVLSILLSTIKMGMVGGISVQEGLVFFGLAVLSSMLLVHRKMSGYELRPKQELALKR